MGALAHAARRSAPRVGAPEVSAAAHRLDKHYIPARYPNGLAAGYPGKLYTADEARETIAHARAILDACRRGLS